MTKKVEKIIEKIAKESFVTVEMRGDLKRRWNDEEDFLDVAIWEIENALLKAYEAGKNSIKK